MKSFPIRARSRGMLLSFGLALALAAEAAGSPTATFTHNQPPACVAPCAVLFDATTTTDSVYDDEFTTLRYVWNFGDVKGESWKYSGRAKNSAIGGIAGHTFTAPGSFLVELTVTNPDGASDQSTHSVTVSDPALLTTRCVSASGNFSDCPAGAEQVTSSDFDATLLNVDGSRTLYRRGEVFTGGAATLVDASATGAIVSAFGLGANWPTMAGVRFDGNQGQGWKVTGLKFDGEDTQGNALAPLGGALRGFTAYDNEIVRWNRCVAWADSTSIITGNAVVDLECTDFPFSGAASKIYETVAESIWMGIHIDVSGVDFGHEFNSRSMYSYKEVWQHTKMEGTALQRNAFQFRGCNVILDDWCFDNGTPSKYLIFSDNHVIDGLGNIPATIRTTYCATGSRGPNCLGGNPNEDFIFERNLLQVDMPPDDRQIRVFWLQATQGVVRNNLIDYQGAETSFPKHIVSIESIQEAATGGVDEGTVHVLNNTAYFADSFPKTIYICVSGDVGHDHRCENNLVVAPNAVEEPVVTRGAGFIATGGNRFITSSTSPFPLPLPGLLATKLTNGLTANFRPNPWNSAVEAGVDLAQFGILRDFSQQLRPGGLSFDAGAFEVATPDSLTDSDGDGIPDIYETETGVFVSPTDTGTDPGSSDTDGDDTSDGDELLQGTDPNDATSVLHLPSLGLVASLLLMAVLGYAGVRVLRSAPR